MVFLCPIALSHGVLSVSLDTPSCAIVFRFYFYISFFRSPLEVLVITKNDLN